jgi:hypothetical protein
MRRDMAIVATVADILRAYAQSHGFVGLYRDGCCCSLHHLAPCGGARPDCRVGVARMCSCGDWFIGPPYQQVYETCLATSSEVTHA